LDAKVEGRLYWPRLRPVKRQRRLLQAFGEPLAICTASPAALRSVLGAQAVARARPDGHTLLVQYSGFHVGSPAVVRNLGWNPRTDVVPVALLMDVPQVLLLHPAVPATTFAEFVAYAKANPTALNYASSGNGSVQHLGTEQLKRLTGIQMEHVPYRGAGPAIQDLLAGRVQVFLTTPPPALAFLQTGQLRALLLSAQERHPALPSVPTAAEAGLPGLSAEAWFGVFAPARTPVRNANRRVAPHVCVPSAAKPRSQLTRPSGPTATSEVA
jgi:tripartite-type tricarboxylate transporter receptor subunit TctC